MTRFLDLLQHAGFGPYAIAFVVTATESLAFVGLFVPGAVIVLGLGALVITGQVSVWTLTVLRTAGAIVGDGVSYEWDASGAPPSAGASIRSGDAVKRSSRNTGPGVS